MRAKSPTRSAARIALTTVRDCLATEPAIGRATFWLFDAADMRIYRKVARALFGDA
jgi:O-acetyl-ADP-ribose deacetylase (regulator of RNase III)